MTDTMEKAVEAAMKQFQTLRYTTNCTDEIIIKAALTAALPFLLSPAAKAGGGEAIEQRMEESRVDDACDTQRPLLDHER